MKKVIHPENYRQVIFVDNASVKKIRERVLEVINFYGVEYFSRELGRMLVLLGIL